MFHSNKPFFVIFILVVFLSVPMTRILAHEEHPDMNTLQTQIIEAKEKIASLSSNQQSSDQTLAVLRADLTAMHQEINALKVNNGHMKLTDAGVSNEVTKHVIDRKPNGRGIRRR